MLIRGLLDTFADNGTEGEEYLIFVPDAHSRIEGLLALRPGDQLVVVTESETSHQMITVGGVIGEPVIPRMKLPCIAVLEINDNDPRLTGRKVRSMDAIWREVFDQMPVNYWDEFTSWFDQYRQQRKVR